MTPPIDRRTLLAGTLASATLAAPATAQSFPLPQGFCLLYTSPSPRD